MADGRPASEVLLRLAELGDDLGRGVTLGRRSYASPWWGSKTLMPPGSDFEEQTRATARLGSDSRCLQAVVQTRREVFRGHGSPSVEASRKGRRWRRQW